MATYLKCSTAKVTSSVFRSWEIVLKLNGLVFSDHGLKKDSCQNALTI
jgi:hypothetical protein